jgi:hypothetical protein
MQAIADQRDVTVKQSDENRTDMLDGKLRKLSVSEVAGITPLPTLPSPPPNAEVSKAIERANTSDADFSVLNQQPNADLVQFVQLFDSIIASNHGLHSVLIWPHIPPRAILPWMVREVTRGRRNPPLRTLFLNMSRPALQAMSGIEAKTARLRALGVYRSDLDGHRAGNIDPDAHFYMFLGNTRESGIQTVPLISIIAHAVALNDGTYWRDFDEKTLKGFKRYFPQNRLQSIRKYLDVLTSATSSPAFAFLLPSHFEASARKDALRRLPGTLDLVVIDLGTAAVGGRNASTLLCEILAELEQQLRPIPKKVLILTDCPLRFSFIRPSLKNRRDPGELSNKADPHRLVWASRGRGFDPIAPLEKCAVPSVETIGSQECVIATRLWEDARRLDDDNPLARVLGEGAAALKTMALTASGADAMLKPYGDTHDVYHRIKRERHSFEPHYANAMALIGEGRSGAWRDKIEADLGEALSLARGLRAETPLMRYLKRMLTIASADEDILVVLRHAEDAQQTGDLLLDFLTAPGSFSGRIPNVRVTTPSRYTAEVETKRPTTVVWTGSATAGMRAFVGDSFAPNQFRLVVAGQDALTIKRSLELVTDIPEYAAFSDRVRVLKNALPWIPHELGGIAAALNLDPDKPRGALPFTGHGHLLLDGYGPVSASPGTQFYVVDPATQQLHPREARSIEVGDSVFVMSADIREEIEALLREKDEQGRTLEQALVDHYKEIVKSGIEKLSRDEGHRITAARVHELLFERNPGLPPISKYAVEYWLQAADNTDVDTPFAASDPAHIEAFLRLMGAGVIARQLTDAVRVVRHALQRDGHTNRALFDRLLLDADSLMHAGRRVTFEKLQSFRDEALENVFPVLEIHLEDSASKLSEQPVLKTVGA